MRKLIQLLILVVITSCGNTETKVLTDHYSCIDNQTYYCNADETHCTKHVTYEQPYGYQCVNAKEMW